MKKERKLFTRDQKWTSVAMTRLDLPSPHFTDSKSVYTALWRLIIFNFTTPFSQMKLRNSIKTRWQFSCQMFWQATSLRFTSSDLHGQKSTMSRTQGRIISICILLLRKKFLLDSFFPIVAVLWKVSEQHAFPVTTILTFQV